MTNKLESGTLVGRPFGGLAILMKKSLHVKINIIDVHHNCRALALTVQFMSRLKIMLIVVYFPCFKVGPNYKAEISDCLGFIEKCICDIFDDLVILGDFNFNCDERSEGYLLFKAFADNYHIVFCEYISLNEIGYTYMPEHSDHRFTIDHIFISEVTNSVIALLNTAIWIVRYTSQITRL